MMTIVVPQPGFYVVGSPGPAGLQTEQVNKGKHCTCGGSGDQPCSHIRAVALYLQLGGEQAAAVEPQHTAGDAGSPDVCPLCMSPVLSLAGRWRCIASAGHYWQWRGEQSGVKAFLTQPHPAKGGAFYEQSPEERDAFLEQISHRRHGYSPYR